MSEVSVQSMNRNDGAVASLSAMGSLNRHFSSRRAAERGSLEVQRADNMRSLELDRAVPSASRP